jgi:hypothetical protein
MCGLLRQSACAAVLLFSFSQADVFFQGKVINPFGFPIKNAAVVYNSTLTATTNDSGEFVLAGPQQILDPSFRRAVPASIFLFSGWHLRIGQTFGKRVEISIVNSLGRVVYSKIADRSISQDLTCDLNEHGKLASGFYAIRLKHGVALYRTTFVVQGDRIAARPMTIEASSLSGLAKANAVTNFHATATGYADRDFSFDRNFDLGIELMMLYPGQAIPAPIVISDSQETRNLQYAAVYWGDENTLNSRFQCRLSWANSLVQSYEKIPGDTLYSSASFTFHYSNLNNGLIGVSVSPEMGSRVVYMKDMTKGSNRQMFAIPGATSVLNCGKFNNIGGIKPSFPITENSTGAIDPTGQFGYRAGYFIQTHPDGAASVIMNMRFDYNQRQEDCAFLGKYGDRPLTTVVTVRPGTNMLSVRYCADNVNPTPRHNAIWNDAVLPSIPKSTTTSSSWIFPTKWAINHCAYDATNSAQYWDMTIKHPGSAGVGPWRSYFGLYPQYGFSGAYYSSGDASHVRINDPVTAPGMKIYDEPTIPELWGSTNVLFEGFNGLVGAFQPVYLPLNYFMTKSIGRITFANEYVAITATGTGSLSYKLMSPRAGIVSVYNYNQTSSPLIADVRIGPDTVISGTCQSGLRVVSKDGTELCNVALPLQFTDNSNTYAAVKATADSCGCNGYGPVAPANLDARFGTTYEKEETAGPNAYIKSLASLPAAANVTSSNNSEILISMARAAYKVGGFAAVNTYLTKLGANKPQEANLLRALMNMELGATADFSNTPIEGNYFRALQAIAAGNTNQAITYLDQLLTAKPDAIRPRILRMFLKKDLNDAAEVYKRVPGSMELWVALKDMGIEGADQRAAGLLQQNEMANIRAADFLKEIKQGIWRHERRYEYNSTWYEGISMPAFPDTLKYKGAPGPIQ